MHNLLGVLGYTQGEQGCSNWHAPNADPNDQPVPGDISRYYRQLGPNRWAYVCPHCRYIFEPWWGDMPDSFRTHINEPDFGGQGCFFKQPGKMAPKKGKGLESF